MKTVFICNIVTMTTLDPKLVTKLFIFDIDLLILKNFIF